MAAETPPTGGKPGGWASLTALLSELRSDQLDDARRKADPAACVYCGEPLISGHCTSCGTQMTPTTRGSGRVLPSPPDADM